MTGFYNQLENCWNKAESSRRVPLPSPEQMLCMLSPEGLKQYHNSKQQFLQSFSLYSISGSAIGIVLAQTLKKIVKFSNWQKQQRAMRVVFGVSLGISSAIGYQIANIVFQMVKMYFVGYFAMIPSSYLFMAIQTFLSCYQERVKRKVQGSDTDRQISKYIMFREDQYFEAKVLLRSYKDSLECIKVSAERKKNLDNYENLVKVIIDAKKSRGIEFKYEDVQKGPKFEGLKEIKLFQFSNFIFKKYIGTFDDFDGEYEGLKKTLNDGLANMQKDYDTATAKKN